MQDKFDPNYNLGNMKFCDIVIQDFKGRNHLVAEDYLTVIGKDKQVMQYINPESSVAQEIKRELQNAAVMQKNKGIVVRGV